MLKQIQFDGIQFHDDVQIMHVSYMDVIFLLCEVTFSMMPLENLKAQAKGQLCHL